MVLFASVCKFIVQLRHGMLKQPNFGSIVDLKVSMCCRHSF